MNRWKVSALLFGSGLAALVYQTAWLREFRLIFGASTAASAAVLAIFMGGLGLGGLILGRRADRVANPLAMYANLEFGVAISAALTPFLIQFARWVYVSVGGTHLMGELAGTIVRILLAIVVLGIPTFLMGGTLPAAARAAETEEDLSRRHLALLYGLNTVGAVAGALLSTFFLLELLGNNQTLWMACGLNALVAMTARVLSRQLEARSEPIEENQTSEPVVEAGADPRFVLAAAAIVGFAFFLMEIVWYRMLGPLLGGSTFTFGLILAVALAGIGLGGAAYSLLIGNRRVSLNDFALTAAFEALCIAFPFMLGDDLAILTLLLRELAAIGFQGHIIGWTIVTSIVVLPGAFVAGIQFPLLIALLGQGREDVGRHVGLTYVWNTVGAIAGALAGGFGLLPLLTAPGTWRLVTILLAGLGIVAGALDWRSSSRKVVVAPVLVAMLAGVLVAGSGPTAVWRHSGIGAGRSGAFDRNRNGIQYWMNHARRTKRWEAEGVESSVALSAWSGWAFVINGKTDGNARGDAGTQVMAGLVGAILHPDPKRALVVGLGTGSSAGWLGMIPSMERVDVVELEPALLEVAKVCAPVNENVLDNPKVHIEIGDAREWILTTRGRYDVIFSEPSNPYRAGIASLFTREFYESAADALDDDGLFLQWLQAYEVDAQTVKTVYATLATVFDHVETWQTTAGDLLLIGSRGEIVYDADRLRGVIREEPYRTALLNVWRVTDLEGFLAHYVGGPGLTKSVVASSPEINTDDRTPIEFGFARSVGTGMQLTINEIRSSAHELASDRPEIRHGFVDWTLVDDRTVGMAAVEGSSYQPGWLSPIQHRRSAAFAAFVDGNFAAALSAWQSQTRAPNDPMEILMVAESLADRGSEEALAPIDQLQQAQPIEAEMVLARLLTRQKRYEEAADHLAGAFVAYRTNPWPNPPLTRRMLPFADELANLSGDPSVARKLFDSIAEPFSVMMLEEFRFTVMFALAQRADTNPCNDAMRLTLDTLEPWVPWHYGILKRRAECYEAWGDPRFGRAQDDLFEYLDNQPTRFMAGLEQVEPDGTDLEVPAIEGDSRR